MKSIEVPARAQVSPESQLLFDQLQKRLGMVPNLLATIGYSANALKGLLNFEALLNNGAFNPEEREAIALVVSEANHCTYCLAAHTLRAGNQGASKEYILSLRRGETTDKKLNAILQLAKSITLNKGEVHKNLLEDFFEAGYNESALIELVGLVSVRTFTNYVYSLTAIPLDYAEVEALN